MNLNRSSSGAAASVLSALLLITCSGAALSASAQDAPMPVRQSAALAATVDFKSAAWLRDRKVVNNNGEEIANVSDLILNRGSGRIEYLVVKTGSILGMGGRAVAIPYAAFSWELGGKDRFMLAMTPEQLKQLPEYSAESWKESSEATSSEHKTLHQKVTADAEAAGDPYFGTLDTAKKAHYTGTVKSVERVRTSSYGEQVVVTVEESNGASHRVALGPSWYVNASSAAPMRGDAVVVDALALPREPDGLLAATDLRISDRELHLRSTDGSPVWAMKAADPTGSSAALPRSRHLLLTRLDGMHVDCRGQEAGKVHDVIFDRNSGEIAFLCIDPNQNFLGIGDTKRLVPWSVASVTLDGTVRIDASKEMVLASGETPSDISTLNTSGHSDAVYKAYAVPTPRFDAPAEHSALIPAAPWRAWSEHGIVIDAIERGTTKTFEGSIVSLSEIAFENNVQPARALTLHAPGDGNTDQIVLVGPSAIVDNQKPAWKVGQSAKVEACRTTINGKQYWLARSVQSQDVRTVLIDSGNAPVWARQ